MRGYRKFVEHTGQESGEWVVMQYTRWVKEDMGSRWARLTAQMRQDVGGIGLEGEEGLVAGEHLGGVEGVVSVEVDDVESSYFSSPSDIFVS